MAPSTDAEAGLTKLLEEQASEASRNSRYSLALDYYDVAARLTPAGSRPAAWYAGRAFAEAGMALYDEAIADFTTAISTSNTASSPEHAFWIENRGMAYLNLGDYEQARADFDSVLAQANLQKPLRSFAQTDRGILFLLQDKYPLAISDLANGGHPRDLALAYIAARHASVPFWISTGGVNRQIGVADPLLQQEQPDDASVWQTIIGLFTPGPPSARYLRDAAGLGSAPPDGTAAACALNFYLGEYALLLGDSSRAHAFLARELKTAATECDDYPEPLLAAHELERLSVHNSRLADHQRTRSTQ